jgi:MoxR-like ATPase
MDLTEAEAACGRVLDAVGEAVVADRSFLETVLLGVLARGHVLLEDAPGTGKTLTARSTAGALGLTFSRIQFTPDLLPADVTGTHVYDESEAEFRFEEGPVFANVVLADEINRAPPKTQSALLEAMEERQVTADGETRPLPEPFFVIATQNPIEQEGTFPLPEAQIDRFAVKTSIGYPDAAGEVSMLRRRAGREARSPSTGAVLSPERVRALQAVPETIRVDDDLLEYVVDVARATREDGRVGVGVSPRGTQRLFEAARARAVIEGREYATPDHVAAVAPAVLAHRLVLTPDARVGGTEKATVVADVLDRVAVPTVEA